MKTRTGYYTVGTKVIEDKLAAVLEATRTGAEVEWHFNNEIYDNIDWTVEPELSLDDYYKLRAQQIRDEYDYVVILCSGGGDSTNVVWSFLNNGILVDEVVASAPIGGLSGWKDTTKDTSAGNTMSETMLAQLPLMHEIHSKHPDVKITINDYFETLLDYQTDDWIFRCGEWIHPSSGARYNLDKQTHIKQIAEQGKKIAIVYGIDKPHLFYDTDGDLSVMISDLTVNVQRPPFNDKYTNVHNVLFYFAPEMPQLQVKQAHSLAKWIHMPENKFARDHMLDVRVAELSLEASRTRHSFYERAIIPCIYPTTNRKVFQGHKPTRMFLGEHDDWFYKMHNNTRAFELIVSDFKNFMKQIDPKYLNPPRTGFKVHRLKYKIGPTFKFLPSVIIT
jgi:hypothetical protein